MPKIDKFLQMMSDKEVERALLQSDRAFQVFSGEQRVEGSHIPAAQLLELLEEIVPPAMLAPLRGGGAFHFAYGCSAGDFEFGVDNSVDCLKLSIAPAKTARPQPTASAMNQPSHPSLKRELYVHRGGANVGPMTPEAAGARLGNGEFAPHDLAIVPHLPTWASLTDVLASFGVTVRAATPPNSSLHSNGNANGNANANVVTVAPTYTVPSNLIRSFLNEEQDPNAVTRVVERLKQLCTPDEEILYIAVQKKPVVTLAPVSVALTSKRVIIFRPKAMGLGLSFEDFLWRTVADIHISEAILGATFTVRLTDRAPASVDSLPKAQARRLYQFGQQMEEQMHSHRRDLMLEEKRSGAGQVNVNNTAPTAPVPMSFAPPVAPPTVAPADDPVEKLDKLKALLDRGLISQSEYDAKKAEILARF